MSKINQQQIANVLNVKQGTVSKYLNQKLSIKLIDAVRVSEALKVPIRIFIDSEVQIKFFGKSYINENIPSKTA